MHIHGIAYVMDNMLARAHFGTYWFPTCSGGSCGCCVGAAAGTSKENAVGVLLGSSEENRPGDEAGNGTAPLDWRCNSNPRRDGVLGGEAL